MQISEQQESKEDKTEENLDVENDAGTSHDGTLGNRSQVVWKARGSDSVTLLRLKQIKLK